MSRGIKFAKDGKTIASTNPDDYNFWTAYPPLNFLEKKSTTVTAKPSVKSGTKVVSHSYGFSPVVFVEVQKQGGTKYLLPAQEFDYIACDFGLYQVLQFGYSVFDSKVEVYWTADCALMGSSYGVLYDQVFNIYLYFYLWELGKTFPFS